MMICIAKFVQHHQRRNVYLHSGMAWFLFQKSIIACLIVFQTMQVVHWWWGNLSVPRIFLGLF